MNKRLGCLLMAVLLMIYAAMPVNAAASGSDVSVSDVPVVSASDSANQESDFDVMETTAAQIAEQMNLGWNLGDSFDSWSSEAGYDDYHNANAYQMVLRYDNADDVRSTSIATSFDENNKCTYKWSTGLIDTDANAGLGDIGFEIWNKTVEEDTTITINVTKALLTRRTGYAYNMDELLGEHTITISKYGTTAVLTEKFPSQLSRTYGITDGTFEVTVELVDFPQKEYDKVAYFETLENNPQTTFEMIEVVKNSGFNAVRIPITYYNHVVSETNVIDTEWLDRIEEVVDYCYYQDMFCVLCMDNDSDSKSWLRVNTSNSDAVCDRFEALWTQIAERFKDYDQRVLFQGFNEMTDGDNTWVYPGEEDISWVNQLNQLFVDTVRATGGRNGYRTLVLGTYAASHEQQMIDGFVLPQDTVSDRLMVSVNAYAPALFSYSVDETTTSFTDVHEWGSEADKAELDTIFERLYNRFVSKGIPVMIGEFCTADKGNTEDRAAHAAYYTAAADKRGIPCFWWDDGGLLLRNALAWNFPEIVDAMVDSTSVHLKHVQILGLDEQYYTGETVIPDLTVVWLPDGGEIVIPDPDSTVSGGDTVSPGDTATELSIGDYLPANAVVLTKGVDYEMICFDNVDIGTATVTLTGIGEYSGVRTEKFTIKERPREVDFLSVLSEENPQLPFMIMTSVPIFLVLAFISVWRAIKRRESDRIRATVNAAMSEEMEKRRQEQGEYGYGEQSIYKGDRSYDNNRALNEYMDQGEYDDL